MLSGRIQDNLVGFIVLDGIFEHPPSLEEASKCHPLETRRFGLWERPDENAEPLNIARKYALGSTRLDWKCELQEFTYIGQLSTSAFEEVMKQDIRAFTTWDSASHNAEAEWRWKHDKELYLAEICKATDERDKQDKLKKERFENRLSKLTWEKIEFEVLFRRWVDSPPFPSPEFTDALRGVFSTTIFDLRELGEKPKRAEVRKRLKQTIDEITSLDEHFGDVIETEEREDIYEVFYDLTYLSKQTKLMEEIPDWHDNW